MSQASWDASPAGAPLACANGKGRLCQVVDALGSTYYAYDAFGNAVSNTVAVTIVDEVPTANADARSITVDWKADYDA